MFPENIRVSVTPLKQMNLPENDKTNKILEKREGIDVDVKINVGDTVRTRLSKSVFDKIGKRFGDELYRVEKESMTGSFKLRKLSTVPMLP